MDVQEMEGGVIAIKNISGQNAGWLDTIPPLASFNENGVLTSEISNTLISSYKESQAVLGAFERFYGKMEYADSIDEQVADNPDVTTGPDKVKAYENITANLGFTREDLKNRLEGAVRGGWDYDTRAYYRHKNLRMYELIVGFGPDVQSLEASSFERLRRYIGVRLERVEHEYANPVKFRLPIFSRRVFDFPNWVEPTPVDMYSSPETVLASTSFPPDNAIQSPKVFHTRLKFVFDSIGTGGDVTVTGNDIFGRTWTETFTIAAGSSEYITKQYFSSIQSIVLGTGWATGTMQASEYDATLIGA